MPTVPKAVKPVRKVVPAPKGKVSPPAPNWMEDQEIKLDNGSVVKARRLGVLAVHRGIGSLSDLYKVTSITTGRWITHTTEETDCIRIAEYLWCGCGSEVSQVRVAFQQSKLDQIIMQIPKWVIAWCVACREAEAWVDPKEYQR